MKTYKHTSATKLLARFDNELKEILANDLKLFMEKNPFLATKRQAQARQTLAVA